MEMVTGWTGESVRASGCAAHEQRVLRRAPGDRRAHCRHLAPETETTAATEDASNSLTPHSPRPTRRPETALPRSVVVAGGFPQAKVIADDGVFTAAELRLVADQNICQALTRLDHLADRESGTARSKVAERLTQLDRRHLLDRADRRSRIGQPSIAQALAGYYRDASGGYGRYGGARAPKMA